MDEEIWSELPEDVVEKIVFRCGAREAHKWLRVSKNFNAILMKKLHLLSKLKDVHIRLSTRMTVERRGYRSTYTEWITPEVICVFQPNFAGRARK